MLQYLTIEGDFQTPDSVPYHSFGLKVMDADQEILSLPDISTDSELISRLAALFTSEQLAPIHLHEVVEDILM